MIREMVKEENFEVIVIDSLNGYIQSMPQENFLVLQLHELFAFLNNQGVVTLISLAQQGMIGTMSSPVDLTYLADTVVLARFFESKGKLCKALSVIKKRTGDHERSIRAYNFGPNGIEVGMILNEFEGILTGVPKYSHEKTKELKAAGRKRTAKKITKRKSAK
jgi:circadian clock protein KaiC